MTVHGLEMPGEHAPKCPDVRKFGELVLFECFHGSPPNLARHTSISWSGAAATSSNMPPKPWAKNSSPEQKCHVGQHSKVKPLLKEATRIAHKQ